MMVSAIPHALPSHTLDVLPRCQALQRSGPGVIYNPSHPERHLPVCIPMSELRHVGTLVLDTPPLAVVVATFIGFAALVPHFATAEDDHPVCGEEGSAGKHCWAQLTNPSGCRFFSMQLRDVDTDVAWSGACEDGRATGEGALSDTSGNQAEDRFVAGCRDGLWKWRFADGVTKDVTYADGLANGPMEMTFPVGRHIQGHYEHMAMPSGGASTPSLTDVPA